MKEITVNAHAKINLYLEVVGLRPDGYHDLESTMHAVGLCDEVTVSRDGLPGIRLTCSDPSLPCGESNLACRAARAFFAYTGHEGGIRIHIKKVIPECAGLAGGSSDAAAVLHALNTLFDTELDSLTLRQIGRGLGADVPFCILGGAAKVGGIGDRLEACTGLPHCYLVVAEGDYPVSTPRAFAELDRLERVPRQGNPMTALLRSGDLRTVCGGLYNAFELVSPSCFRLKDKMVEFGAVGSLMSGSGSAVYGLFQNRRTAASALDALRNTGRRAWLCTVG